MNRLLEIWSEKGFPIKTNSENYKAVIADLQSRLDKIYQTFTGDTNEEELACMGGEESAESSFSNDSIYPLRKGLRSSQWPHNDLFS